jgi:hypothetical protein
MPCSSPSGFLIAIRLRVLRIRGGDWSSFDAGRSSHCFREQEAQRVGETLLYLRQGNASNHACLNQIQAVSGR